jgi:deoxyribodipyrimidine photo-lyase
VAGRRNAAGGGRITAATLPAKSPRPRAVPCPDPLPARLPSDPRLRVLSTGTPGHRGKAVVYWAQAARRATSNAALSLAIAEANARRLPLLVYEALRVDYPFASDRFHAFVLEGARGEAAAYRARGAAYAFFLPRSVDEARGVVAELARQADLVVTDESPSFIFSAQTERAARASPCPVWAFDDSCVVPLSLFAKEQYAARTLRPRMARALPDWLKPIEEPTCAAGPARLELPFAPLDLDAASLPALLASLPIDHTVGPVAAFPGGSAEARARLEGFVARRLARYPEQQSHPDDAARSSLSPYLHFGMISPREIALRVRSSTAPLASREAFLEQLLVRRTLSFNLARENPSHRSLAALPSWAAQTLARHEGDPRPQLYAREQLEAAATADPVWNAAQRELLATGIIHNYVRMLWGKRVIPWKRTAVEAFDDLVYLNDRYALDGRDPNSYASILWCFGKHDRPWPERPVFGTVRTMSSEAARKKLRMEGYLARWGGE